MNQSHASLYYYTVVVEEMNISRAASRLYISQQSLSDHIKRLEKQHDTAFFERTPRLKLTYAGEKMYEYAKSVLSADEMLAYAISGHHNSRDKKLNLGMASHRGNVFLPELINIYSEKHLNVLLSVTEGPTEFMSALLHSGKLDVYFTMHDPNVNYGKSIRLLPEECYLLVSRKLLLKTFGNGWKDFMREHMHDIEAPDMARFPLILPTGRSPMREIIDKYFASFSLTPNIYLEDCNNYAMYKMCSFGQSAGISAMPFLYDVISDTPNDSQVFSIPIRGISASSYFEIVYDDRSIQYDYVRDFIDCSKSVSDIIRRKIDKNLKDQFAALGF